MTKRAPRDHCRLPAPSWCLDGRVATSVPTAARIAAADSGLPRGRRALSGPLHTMRRLARQSWQSGASRLRPSCHARTPHRLRAPTNGSFRGPLLHRQATTSRRSRPKRPPEETTNTQKKKTDLASCVPLYSSWLLAPPSFELLREASRKWALLSSNASLLPVYRSAPLPAPAGSFEKGGVTHFQRLTPMNRPMTNDLPFSARGKTGGKIRAPSEFLLVFHWRSRNPLFLFLGRDGWCAERVVAGLWRRGSVVGVAGKVVR